MELLQYSNRNVIGQNLQNERANFYIRYRKTYNTPIEKRPKILYNIHVARM